MKKLITILILALTLTSLNAQLAEKHNKKPYAFKKELRKQKNWRLIGTVGTSIALGLSDGFNLNGKQEIGHPLKYLAGVMFLAGGIFGGLEDWKDFSTYLIQASATNFALFDNAHNLAAGLKPDYYGNTHIYDRTMKGIPYHGVVFVKSISFTFAIMLNFQEYGNK